MLNRMHRFTAMFLGLYVILHLFNHLAGYWGPDTHIAMMQTLRKYYLHPIGEVSLIAAIAMQVSTGFFFVLRRWSARRSLFEYAQAFSGLYLGFFMVTHVAMIMNARMTYGLDSNFYFAAAGMNLAGFRGVLFTAYYFIAIVALFTHLAAAARWWMISTKRSALGPAAAGITFFFGLLVALAVVYVYCSDCNGFDIPQIYSDAYL